MNTLPAATSRLSDVTVPFVYSVSRRWYVLRASYGREEQGALYLLNQGYYAYVAGCCAATFDYYGRFMDAEELRAAAERIYALST